MSKKNPKSIGSFKDLKSVLTEKEKNDLEKYQQSKPLVKNDERIEKKNIEHSQKMDNNSQEVPLDKISRINGTACDNFYLKLHKAVKWKKKDGKLKAYFYETEKGKVIYQIQHRFNREQVDSIAEEQKKAAEAISSQPIPLSFKVNVNSKMIIGLGSPSVYETSMTLHHIYGIPYVPGQAVKGITRHWFLQEIMNKKLKNVDSKQVLVIEKFFETVSEDEKSENRFEKLTALKDKELKAKFTINNIVPEDTIVQFLKGSQEKCKEFQSLFGTQKSEGKVIFFDAFPTGEIKLKTDIMTPHYGDYYGNKKDKKGNPTPPADYLSPNPIPFLTVEDTTFQFVVGVRKRFAKEKEDIVKKVQELIESALKTHGIGAKTAVGYGYLEKV